MSTQKLLPFKNRIAPQYLKTILVLCLFLSSIVLSPLGIISSPEDHESVHSEALEAISKDLIKLPLIKEKMDVLVGKEDSILVSIDLEGGNIEVPFDLSSLIYSSITQIDFIVAEQSSFAEVWTNPLWQFPDGLIVRITARTMNRDVLYTLSAEVNSLIEQLFGVSLNIYDVQKISSTEVLISLMAPLEDFNIISIFQEIFAPYNDSQYGNMVSLIGSLLSQSLPIYAFGYSLKKGPEGISRITRRAIVAIQDSVVRNGELRTFDVSESLGANIEPNPSAIISRFTFNLPFYANITNISLQPDNVAPHLTGSFEWVLKFMLNVRFPAFDCALSYYPFSANDFEFPRVFISNSYSDALLEESGILKMTYNVQNMGTAPAYNTTVVFPIPPELKTLQEDGIVIPVLNDDWQVNESFTSFVELKVQYASWDYTIPILDVQGWYDNTISLSPARWLDNETIELNGYATIYCSNGISLDLYEAVSARIQPILDEIDIIELTTNFTYRTLVLNELALAVDLAVDDAYNTVYGYFYHEKPMFNFSSNDFESIDSYDSSYLVATISDLDVNETCEIFWMIEDIPTSNDKFGAFSFSIETSGSYDYAVFKTTESDYKNLMIALFAVKDSGGRFLSSYDASINAFISTGSIFQYSDSKGIGYYGLTNGLNLQLGDDEAVLESLLYSEESIYRVGDQLSFTLNISNFGTIPATDIHVDIANIRFNYLWQPTDVVFVKSFDIDQINANENLSREFSISANSYIGLNTYVAIISFISDKDQPSTEVENPWTDTIIPWIYGGETINVITSTLSFGILLPPESLENQPRPAFPLPEITINYDYSLSSNNETAYIEYEIINEGMSPTNVSVNQLLDLNEYTLEAVNCTYVHEGVETTLVPITSPSMTLTRVSFANITLYPGDSLVIEEIFTDLPSNFTIPPLIIKYNSIYEIITTDFASIENSEDSSTDSSVLSFLKLSPATVTERDQNLFPWTSYSPIIYIHFPVSDEYDRISFSPLPYVYPLISTAVLAGVTVIAMIISRLRK
ncbi:MAG: hypothetical protein HGN29_13910 [Asgard group archaeon]|nr:hypothetical protein [Asgard group archaeon]